MICHVGSIQRVVPLSTTLLNIQNPLLREDLEMSRHAGRIDIAAFTQTHSVLRSAAVAKPTHQRESVDFTQGLQKARKFFYFKRIHWDILSIFAQSCKQQLECLLRQALKRSDVPIRDGEESVVSSHRVGTSTVISSRRSQTFRRLTQSRAHLSAHRFPVGNTEQREVGGGSQLF